MIDKSAILTRISGSREAKDYTYAILFLLISSFFGLFVVKPVLSIAVSLDKESKDLEKVNQVFEKNITNMVMLQTQMQEIRAESYLIDVALPSEPSIQTLLSEVRQEALKEGINLKTIEIVNNESERKQDGKEIPKATIGKGIKKIKPITMTLVVESDFDQAIRFTKKIMTQKRLKVINKISLSKDLKESGAGFLTISVDVEGYYF